MHRLIAFLVIATALAIPSVVSADVQLISFKSPVQIGTNTTLTVSVSPARLCSLAISNGTRVYQTSDTQPKSPKKRQVSWTWKIAKTMALGTWTVKVSCGSAGTLTTSMKVAAYSTVRR